MNTALFGERMNIANNEMGVDVSDIKHRDRINDEGFQKEVKKALDQIKRGDVVGVDIAGAENHTMDKLGRERLEDMYDALLSAHHTSGPDGGKGEPIVLRPHVGEGANDVEAGADFLRDGNRQLKDGVPSHVARARENIDQMLQVFEGVAAKHGGTLPDGVIVRFGHATHATPEQAAMMAKLGIIAEVNLTSNNQTGASHKDPKSPTQDNTLADVPVKPYDGSVPNDLTHHAIGSMIANGTTVILSTDAHAVMSTDLGQEHRRAAEYINDVLSGKSEVEVARGVTVKYADMPPEMQARFDGAYQKLLDDAQSYYDDRPSK